jgi:bacillithiol system protein YtxJ
MWAGLSKRGNNKEYAMSDDLREVLDQDAWNDVRRVDKAILYKHSTRCPISWGSKREVERFVEQTPDIPVFLVDVVKHRSLSQQIARDLDVRHESPQAILMLKGEAAKHASHRQITVQLLADWAGETTD